MKDLMRKLNKNILSFSLALRVAAFLILSFIQVSGVKAQQDSSLDQLFTIRDIRVDETAANANRARQAALLQAEEDAYHRLLRKITQPESRAQLLQLTATERQALISGIDFVQEQSSSRRYIAVLNVRFEPSQFSSFLAQYNVPHVLSTGSGILVLHAHQRGLAKVLWQADQPLEAARDEVDWVNRIRRYSFARGNIKERLSVSASEILDLDIAAAERAGRIAGFNSALMIGSKVARLASGELQIRYHFSATDSGLKGEGSINFPSPQASTEIEALVAMYDTILEENDSAWRDRLLVDTGTQGDIQVMAPTVSLADMAQYEKILNEVSLVQSYSISEIGVPLSTFQIRYTGRQDQLSQALKFAGLDLKPYGDQMMIELRTQ
jgi:hypothetical protein